MYETLKSAFEHRSVTQYDRTCTALRLRTNDSQNYTHTRNVASQHGSSADQFSQHMTTAKTGVAW